MAHIKRKYIDSHWLVFIFQGVITLFFGCVTLFTGDESPSALIPVIGISLLALAVVEFANSLYRSRRQDGWLVSTLVALFDAAFGIALLVLSEKTMAWHLALLAAYTALRGVFELLIGFRTTVDPTDRFIWVLCGVCGVIFGFIIFNSGHLPNIDFVRFFGAYMLVLGIASLIYGVHNRSQQIEDREARSEAGKKAVAARRKNGAKTSKKKA